MPPAAHTPERRRALIARAGHPRPLPRGPDGSVSVLDVPGGTLLGVDASARYPAGEVPLPHGSVGGRGGRRHGAGAGEDAVPAGGTTRSGSDGGTGSSSRGAGPEVGGGLSGTGSRVPAGGGAGGSSDTGPVGGSPPEVPSAGRPG
ncbi:SpoIIE family protein phosphatase, partial [Streptomyces sp. NPDC096153]|uniref:SpoIIE family protein phosphatase n=1 Tax=Streptomyces sp. NPDC096153 TaxID=3155548 RepID=UPI003327DAFD